MIQRVILGHLRTRSALHVGSGEAGGVSDAMLRRDVRGRVLIPGTALAGGLRTTATRLAPRLQLGDSTPCAALLPSLPAENPCGCIVCRLFGDLRPGVNDPEAPSTWFYRDPDPSSGGEITQASRLFVYDAILESGSASSLVRDGLGVDRPTAGAARAGAVKFDREVLLPGSVFRLRLELDPSASLEEEILLAAALSEWLEGRCRLGARTACGLGSFELRRPESRGAPGVGYCSRDLDRPEGLLSYLQAEDPWKDALERIDNGEWFRERVEQARARLTFAPAELRRLAAGDRVEVRMQLQGIGTLLTGDAQLGLVGGTDSAPLSDGLPPLEDVSQWRPQAVLAGASLRGLLRSRCEKIARTLWTATVEKSGDGNPLHRCPACNPTESRSEAPLANCDSLLREHEVVPDEEEVDDQHLCLACRLFGSTRRGSRLTVADAPLVEDDRRWWKVRDFVAIDRFLGGALEGAKFDAIALSSPCFDFALELENPQSWELGWLALALRDLYQGRLRVGWGKSKGFGQVQGRNGTLEVRWLSLNEDDLPHDLLARDPVRKSGLYHVRQFNEPDWADQADLLQTWIDEFVKLVEGFQRGIQDGLPPLEADTYFGRPQMTELYGRSDE